MLIVVFTGMFASSAITFWVLTRENSSKSSKA